MLKPAFIITSLLIMASTTYAQPRKNAYDRYLDFNLARLGGDTETAVATGEMLLDSAGGLTPKIITSIYNGLAKIYEDNDEPEKAVAYYQKVVAAEPNYYVAHRALGYLYLDDAYRLFALFNNTAKSSPEYAAAKGKYYMAAKRVLNNLEIAQACDPSDDTLKIIESLYKNMGDRAAMTTLAGRLKKISADCIDILSDN